MKEKRNIIVIVVVILICAIGCTIAVLAINNSESSAETEIDNDEKLHQDLDDYFSVNSSILDLARKYEDEDGIISFGKANDAINAVGDFAEELKNEDKINDYEVSEGDSVWIQFNNGVEYLYSPNVEGYDSYPISTYQPSLSTYSKELQTLGKKNVDGSANRTVKMVDDYEFKNNLDDQSVSLDEIKKIGQNKVSIWHGHGAYNAKTHSLLATALKLDEEKFLFDPIYYIKNIGYTDDFLTGRIVCSSSGYVLVGYKFFDKYLSSIDSSIIYLGACSSGKDDVLANSFINKGAKSVFANTDIIHTDYNLKMIASVFDALITANKSQHFNNCKEALEYAKKKNGKICCSQDPNTEVIIVGKGDVTLSDKVVIEPTEKPTEKPKVTPTERKHVYTAVELASKSLDDIKGIMGGDYQTERVQFSYAFSSEPINYMHNNYVLPGLAFAIRDDDYYGISIMDGAMLNDKISSDMTYNQVAKIIGDLQGGIAGQGEGAYVGCNALVDGYSVTFCFSLNDYIRNHSQGSVTADVLKVGNPVLQSIGLRIDPIVNPTEQPSEAKQGIISTDSIILEEILGSSESRLIELFGNDSTSEQIPGSGLPKCLSYSSLPNVAFGFSQTSDEVVLIDVIDCNQTVYLTQEITSDMTGRELFEMKNKYSISEYHDEGASQYPGYYITLKDNSGLVISFGWNTDDYMDRIPDFIDMQKLA